MAKATILELLFQAHQVLEHDCKINGLTLDDAELNDADVEDAFEAIRSALNTAVKTIKQHVD